jgi:hypothetical protein
MPKVAKMQEGKEVLQNYIRVRGERTVPLVYLLFEGRKCQRCGTALNSRRLLLALLIDI